MTRDEIVAFFQHREDLYNDFDAAALAADYADEAVIDSPIAGVHTGPLAAEQALRAVFAAFLDRTMRTESLLIDGDLVAQVFDIEGTHIHFATAPSLSTSCGIVTSSASGASTTSQAFWSRSAC